MRRLQFRFQTPGGTQLPPEDGLTPGALAASVDKLFSSSHYRPPLLPAAALRVLEYARKPDVSYDAMVGLIESDPLFAASVLKLASSPLYATNSPIRSIQQALLRLGLQKLSDICIEAAMTGRVFKAPGYDQPMELIRRHSLAVAHLARMVSERAGTGAELAFTLGLLHEAGLAASIIALNTSALWPKRFAPARVWAPLREARGAVTEKLVKAWQLPPYLADAMLALTRPETVLEPTRATLVLAEHLSELVGAQIPEMSSEGMGDSYESIEIARSFLALKLSDMAAMESDARKLVSRVL